MASTPVQTEYNERIGLPSPGTIKGSDFNSKTGICEDAAGIGFGLPVQQGDNDQGVKLGGALADFLGVSIRDVTARRTSTDTVDKYNQYSNVGYISQGEIWVEAGAACTPDDPVHYNATTGAWAISGGSGPIPGARWRTSGGVGDRVVLELMARGA